MPVDISTAAFRSWPLTFLPMTKQYAVNGSNITSGKLEGVGVTPIYNDNNRIKVKEIKIQNHTIDCCGQCKPQGVLMIWFGWDVPLEPRNPYPFLRVILSEKGTHF